MNEQKRDDERLEPSEQVWSVWQRTPSRFAIIYGDGDAELGNWLICDNILDRLVAEAIVEAHNNAHTNQQALREAQEALKAQQDLLGCVNEENPWLGVTAGLALRINRLKASEQQAREAQEHLAAKDRRIAALEEVACEQCNGTQELEARVRELEGILREVVRWSPRAFPDNIAWTNTKRKASDALR